MTNPTITADLFRRQSVANCGKHAYTKKNSARKAEVTANVIAISVEGTEPRSGFSLSQPIPFARERAHSAAHRPCKGWQFRPANCLAPGREAEGSSLCSLFY